MTEHKQHDQRDRLIDAYNTMLERARNMIESASHSTAENVRHFVDRAKERAVELGDLTQEEAEKIADYLRRDLEDAAEFLAQPDQELRDWLRFDIALIEQRLLDMFMQVADRTRVELLELEQQARLANLYHTGEITSVGTLQCQQCGQLVHFYATGHIPPCPKCHHTVFSRAKPRT